MGFLIEATAPHRRVSRKAPLPLALGGGLIALAVSLPLLYLFLRAVQGGLSSYLSTTVSSSTAKLLGQTLLLVAGVSLLALAIALPLAWLVVRTDLKARRFWAVAGGLPLVFPSYVSAFSLVAVFGPRGFVQDWIGVERLPGFIYGYLGALLALALFTYPYVYLMLVAALNQMDPALEDSSRSLGAGRLRTFRRVVLPQLRQPIYAGTLLVALYTLSDFGAVSIVRYNTLTLAIYNAYRSLFDRAVAASVSTVLVGVALAFIAIQALLQRQTRPTRRRPQRPIRPVPLGRWQWPCQIALLALSLLTLGTTGGVILHWGTRAIRAGNVLGTAWEAALNSLGVSLLAALVATVCAVPLALWSVRFPSRVSRFAERMTQSGFALPGLVVALSLVFLATRHAGWLYQTLPLLIVAYVVRFLPESLSATHSALAQVSPRFEEAGRSLGRGPLGVWRTVTLPIIRPGLLAGAGLVFLTSMKELPATLILRPIGFETLATRVWSSASEGIFSQAALPAMMLMLAAGPPLYLLAIRPALVGRTRL